MAHLRDRRSYSTSVEASTRSVNKNVQEKFEILLEVVRYNVNINKHFYHDKTKQFI